jgi:hypothetical protein
VRSEEYLPYSPLIKPIISILLGDSMSQTFDNKLDEIIAFKRDELTITITMVGEGDLIDNAIKVVKEVIADMANKMSGGTKGSGTNPDDIDQR